MAERDSDQVNDSFVTEMLEADQSRERLGIWGTEVGQGQATAHLTVESDMINGIEVIHGGFVFSLADYAFACAANSVLSRVATVDAQISFLSPARAGEILVAEAVVSFSGGRRIIVDVTVRSGERTIALFRGTGRTTGEPST
ncbi:hotdog fold thioesterase [Corynebacterium hylobatis]|nr:hotdog fold thioesterase [Corynebacterium hylobatis]